MGIKDISAELTFGSTLQPEASPGAQGRCLWPQGHEQKGTEAAGGPRQLHLLSRWMRIAGWLMDQDDGGSRERRRTPPTDQRPEILADGVLIASARLRKAMSVETSVPLVCRECGRAG